MLCGIKSVHEILHCKMHELIEGLNGVEVIVNDFVVVVVVIFCKSVLAFL